MSWGKLDDQFHSHPKVISAGNEAAGVYARALSYCAAYSTDGFVPLTWVGSIAKPKVLARVTAADLWVEVEAGEWRTVSGRRDSGNRALDDVSLMFRAGGFFIPDFLHHNPSRCEAEAAREKRRAAGSKGGSNSEANAQADALADAKQDPPENGSTPPTRPDLSKEPKAVTSQVDEADGPGFFTKQAEARLRRVS